MDILNTTKWMVSESYNCKTAKDMKENGPITKNMALENTDGRMDAFIKVVIPKENAMARAKWFIKMDNNIKETGSRDKNMEEVVIVQELKSLWVNGVEAS